MARTRMPAASSASTTRRPLVPAAPVTRIIRGRPHRRPDSWHATVEFDDTPLTQYLHLDRIADLEPREGVPDFLTARLVDQRDADGLENDVATQDQVGASDGGLRRAPTDPDRRGRRAVGNALGEKAVRLRQVKPPGQVHSEAQGRDARPEHSRVQED